MLEINVVDGRLSRVRWGSNDVPTICAPDVNDKFQADDYRGEFGLYFIRADATIRNARILLSR
jgi:hypothetical protein